MNKNKILASVMCASTLMSSVLPVFATQTLTNETLNQKEETEVLYNKSASYMVTIPKTITLGSDKTSTYSVKVEGDISSDQEVYVAPVDAISQTDKIDFYMEDQSTSALKKDNVEATVTPTKTVWNFAEVASATEVTDNNIEALKLTSGTWKGTFNFEINLKTLGEEAVALEAGLYDADGVMLCTWEESGIDAETDYSNSVSDSSYFETTTTSAYYVLTNTYPTTTQIVFPNSVTKIGENAFNSCENLTEVIIPNSVTIVAGNAFINCSNLTSIMVDENSQYYCSVDGVLFTNDMTKLVKYPAKKVQTSYTIPESVTSIGAYAFQYCSSLTNITIPESVTSISMGAFAYCSSLTNITIPEGITSIYTATFGECTNLKSIIIPESVTMIDGTVFMNCTNLTEITIPKGVTSIGYMAFSGCTSLTNVTFEDTTTWYVGTSKSAINTKVTVSNPSTNANYLTSKYCKYFWGNK